MASKRKTRDAAWHEAMEAEALCFFDDRLAMLDDPRRRQGLRYPLQTVVAVALMAMVCGADDGDSRLDSNPPPAVTGALVLAGSGEGHAGHEFCWADRSHRTTAEVAKIPGDDHARVDPLSRRADHRILQVIEGRREAASNHRIRQRSDLQVNEQRGENLASRIAPDITRQEVCEGGDRVAGYEAVDQSQASEVERAGGDIREGLSVGENVEEHVGVEDHPHRLCFSSIASW